MEETHKKEDTKQAVDLILQIIRDNKVFFAYNRRIIIIYELFL